MGKLLQENDVEGWFCREFVSNPGIIYGQVLIFEFFLLNSLLPRQSSDHMALCYSVATFAPITMLINAWSICLNSTCEATTAIRQEIEAILLLPQKELENRE